MSGYDSRSFSKEFSLRTKRNLEFIEKVVKRDEKITAYKNDFLNQYSVVAQELQKIENQIREEADKAPSNHKKGEKNKNRGRIHGVANSLKAARENLEKNLGDLVSYEKINDDLYEVTQLLNSLMGIAVLPYEMHRKLFDGNPKQMDEEDSDFWEEMRSTGEYKSLEKFILRLYQGENPCCRTTYSWDLDRNNNIEEKFIVRQFLGHIRNAVCHSGNNAISILPLSGGRVIEEILFYDRIEERGNNDKARGNRLSNEFAMRLSIDQVREMTNLIADFYQNTEFGYIDKTEALENAEKRVKILLKRK